MTSILIVEKNGNIKATTVKNYDESELYKKAGYKSAEGFEEQSSWSATIKGRKYTVKLFAKTEGKANQENKYEFPPPVDSTLFFGNCVLVNVSEEKGVESLSKSEWDQIYDFLFGGFEDLGDDDDEDEDDEDEFEDSDEEFAPRTKEGYIKDDFIVDDDEDEDEDEDDDDEDDEEEVKPKKRAPPAKKANKPPVKTSKSAAKPLDPSSLANTPIENIYLDCTNELDFEDYE